MLKKQSIRNLSKEDLNEKAVFVRVDFNVPIHNGEITDDSRIRAALPTIEFLTRNNAKVILASHLGRPKGEVNDDMRLGPISARLAELMGKPVSQATDCVGDDAKSKIASMQGGDILVLENVRFHKEETDNDPDFAKSLAAFAELYVNDAFGTAHRAHASTAGVAAYLPSVAGLLIEKELEFLHEAIQQPKRPLVAIIGGSKVSTKFGVLKHLLGKVDTLVIGGGMSYTFVKAQGYEVGTSIYEEDRLEEARQFLAEAETSSTKVVFPVDNVVTEAFDNDAPFMTVSSQEIPATHMGLDIGPETTKLVQEEIAKAGTVLWNGPLGVFEMSNFSNGTFAVAEALAQSNAISIVGGGDSVAAIHKAGVSDQISHISTGGGASLEFLEGRLLPGIAALQDA